MRKFFPFALFATLLTACVPQPIVAPVEQMPPTPPMEVAVEPNKTTTNVQNSVSLYQCNKQKSVRVTRTHDDKKTLTVEFNQVSHKLSSAVPKSGRTKFSNIRWTWVEDFQGKGSLRDKSGKVLAENCVKK